MKILNIMKHYMIILPLSTVTLTLALPKNANAQIAVAEVIKAGVKKVIKAVDLKIQRLQNETLWLQNAQKVLENQLSKLKLTEIAEWTDKQKELYKNYYDELWKVKTAITYYSRLKDLTKTQAAIVDEYQWAWQLFTKDPHFIPSELTSMESVYSGILQESISNLDQVLVVVHSFKTQMSDAERLELIRKAAENMDRTYNDLKQFNRQNSMISIQRAKSLDETVKLKELYGISN